MTDEEWGIISIFGIDDKFKRAEIWHIGCNPPKFYDQDHRPKPKTCKWCGKAIPQFFIDRLVEIENEHRASTIT